MPEPTPHSWCGPHVSSALVAERKGVHWWQGGWGQGVRQTGRLDSRSGRDRMRGDRVRRGLVEKAETVIWRFHCQINKITTNKSWIKNVLQDQTEEQSESKKDPHLETERAEHVFRNYRQKENDKGRKKTPTSFKAGKEKKNLVPYMRTSTRLALDFVFGADCDSAVLKAAERCLWRIWGKQQQQKTWSSTIFISTKFPFEGKGNWGCLELPMFNSRYK